MLKDLIWRFVEQLKKGFVKELKKDDIAICKLNLFNEYIKQYQKIKVCIKVLANESTLLTVKVINYEVILKIKEQNNYE